MFLDKEVSEMAKQLLIERLQFKLEYTEKPSTSKGIGHLAGIGADLKKPTRNGRLYPTELWKNVMKSEDYKEMMETRTCFGENDHPSDRVESIIEKASMVLTNMEIREDEGIVWVEFDILPTDAGKLLKAIVDYGSKIGVSSRGLGDEIQRNGETIIDPETYSFYGFDAVVQPAVKSARPNKVESATRAKITDMFKSQIESATTVNELQSLKRLAESVNIPDLDSITESIDNKLSNGSLDGNNISEQLENDLGKLAEENEELKSQLENLKKANNVSAKRSRRLTETFKSESIVARRTLRQLEVKNERLERVNQSINEELRRDQIQLKRLERKQARELEDLQKELEDVLKENRMLKRDLNTANKEIDSKQKQLDDLTESFRDSKSRIIELENEVSTKVHELDSLYEENSVLNTNLEKVSDNLEKANSISKITENKVHDVSTKLTEQNGHLTEALDKYVEAKCLSEGIDKKKVLSTLPAKYTLQDVDMLVEKYADEKRRLNKMPISFNPISAKLENFNGMSPEDAQTMRFLKGFTP